MWRSDRRLYLTPDGMVSEEPVSGGSLLVPEGGELPDDVAERLGLLSRSEKRATYPNKARRPADKGAPSPEE